MEPTFKRMGLFGGTFNPIHTGHLQAAGEILDRFALERILFIPSNIPPHKSLQDMASAADRLEMVRLACGSDPRFVPSDVEVEAGEISYSILTLRRLRRLYPETDFFFLLGVDAFRDIRTWRQHDRVIEECRFIVMTRPGTAFSAAESVIEGEWRDWTRRLAPEERPGEADLSDFRIFLTPIRALNVSATEIRRRIRTGENVRDGLPGSVAAYIRKRGLYRESGNA
jgi:nicotinate-nucleotide adenylyltransferase